MIPKTLTVIIRSAIIKMKDKSEIKRIETKLEIQTYLARLKYAIESGSAVIEFVRDRYVDKQRSIKHTNEYTISKLFPDEDVVTVFQRELINLTINEYIETVKDINRPKYSEMRVFGSKYLEQDVYIKIRVELVSAVHASGENYIFVMSFHFAEYNFNDSNFPYIKIRGERNEKD